MLFKAWEDVWSYLGRDFHADWVRCFVVNTGMAHYPDFTTCEGVGEPMIFYITAAQALQGVLMAAFFLLGWCVRVVS